MLKGLNIFFAISGVLILIASVIILIKDKPLLHNRKENENKMEKQFSFNFGIIMLIQSIAVLLISSAMYFKVYYLYWISFVLGIPLTIYYIKIVFKKK